LQLPPRPLLPVVAVVHEEVLPADQVVAVAQVAAATLDQLQQLMPLMRNTRTVAVARVIAGRFGRRSG
jgi:hypothetical protein